VGKSWFLVGEGRKSVLTFSRPGLIIAAVALRHGLTVVSRDTSGYKMARVSGINPPRGTFPNQWPRRSNTAQKQFGTIDPRNV
jgi:hypothetical protein